MFNLFKKTVKNDVLNTEIPAKTVNEVIEEIHKNFYTEVDKLLANAKIANSLDTDKQDLIDKCERLKKLGFTNTKEVKEAEQEIKRLQALRQENESKKNLIQAINYFSFKYPNYKFITEESVSNICSKYNLVYGTIDRYTGTVPNKNLKHIEDFKIDENDECFIKQKRITDHGFRDFVFFDSFITFKKAKEIEQINDDKSNDLISSHPNRFKEEITKCSLEIAAPLSDFNTNGMYVEQNKLSKIEIPDPIVLKPVIFNSQKYYLIVTAWGDEASDELVVNEKFN